MRGFGAYAVAVAIVLSVLCCANLALASNTTLTIPSSAAIGTAPVGDDLSLIDIGGFLRQVGGFIRVGITTLISGSGGNGLGPTEPTDLVATPVSSSQIDLSWAASTDNIGVAGYQIFRDGVQVATDTSGTTYNDTGLSPATLHSYWVAAYDTAENVSTSSTAVSAVTNYGPDQYGTTWKSVAIGAGGYVDGIDIAPDGTMVVRTDTNGAYLWTGTRWEELVTAGSMPSAFLQPDNGAGVYAIAVAPSNTNVFYMNYIGYLFKSTNKGATWTQTAFSPVTVDANDNYRMNGQKIAVDPVNPNIVYAGTPTNGLFVTTNGGATWSQVSTFSANTSGVGFNIIFDPSSSVVSGATQGIYAASYGTGVYHSTNGGASWTLTSGGPTQVSYLAMATTSVLYAVENGNGNLWRYSGGTWSELFNNAGFGIQAVAVDPFNANHVVYISNSGSPNQSFDGGNTWSGLFGTTVNSTDIPWLATASTWLSTGGAAFDPQVQGKLWLSYGVGVAYTNAPAQGVSPGTVTWNSQSVGIDQLVANEIISPPGGQPVLANWDFGNFYVANPDVFPSQHGPQSGTFSAGWAIDYASNNPNYIASLANWNYGGTEVSGYSTDGGQTWTQFGSTPADVATYGEIGGDIAAASSTDMVWIMPDDRPYYTLDGGNTWTPVQPPGTSAQDSGWGAGQAYYLNRHIVAADRVNIGTFYAYNVNDGVYRSTDGGVTWTLVHSGELSSFDYYASKLRTVPGMAGNLFYTGGAVSGSTLTSPANEAFLHSTDGGATWTAVPNVDEVLDFGFGKAKAGTTTPAIYIAGWVNSQYGIWESDDDANSWTQIGLWPLGTLETVSAISGDMNAYGRVYVGLGGGGYMYGNTANAQIPPIISSISSGTPTTTSATITWTTDQQSNSEVVYGTTISYGSSASNASFVNSHSITLTGLTMGTTYHFEVVSADSQGYAATSTDQTFVSGDTTPPSAPTGLTATANATSSTEIDLSWTASTGNGVDPVAGYQIFRDAAQVGTTTSGTAYADTGLIASTTYTYVVKAYDTVGNVSASSSPATATTGNFGLDGKAENSAFSNSVAATLTTSKPDDVIIVFANTTNSFTGISDTAGLTWNERAIGGPAGGGNFITEEWYAIAPSSLSGDAITVTELNGYASLDAFGISGANTSSPFDSGGPVTGTTTDTDVISTTNANDMLIAGFGYGNASPDPSAGFTLLYSENYLMSEYAIVSSTQTNLSVNNDQGYTQGSIVDAIKAATSQPTGRIIRLTGRIILIGGVRLGGTSPIPRSSYDPATVAWVNAVTTAGGTVSTTQENYVNTLITCYKSAGIFSLLDREWLLSSDNVQQAETDLIHDDTWTSYGTNGFTADAGYTGDGSTSYLNTNFNLSTGGGNYSQNSASVDLYVTHDGGAGGDDIGANASGGCPNTYIAPDGYGDDEFDYAINDCTFPAPADSGAVGLWAVFRTTSTLMTADENGVLFSTTTDSSEAPPNEDFYVGATDTGGAASHFSNDTIAMVGIGGGLTGTQEAAKAACDDAYARSKGFNVF